MTKRLHAPKHAITVRTYAELYEFVCAFAKGGINLMILVGPPGVAKTQTVKRALEGAPYNLVEGNASAFGLYQSLYEHQDELTVIDDIDALYSDKSAVRLLKCLCQTDEVKRLGWFSAAASIRTTTAGPASPSATGMCWGCCATRFVAPPSNSSSEPARRHDRKPAPLYAPR